MRITILGAVEVDGRPITSPQERRFLAVLVLHRNRAVTIATIADAVWNESVPDQHQKTLHSKVSRLRSLVGAERLEHVPAGYRLRVDDGECDADDFETIARRVVASATVDPEQRVEFADAAMRLWGGPLFGDLTYDAFVGGEAVRLEQLRCGVAEARASALVDLARYEEALADLETLMREQPYHDRLCELRMTALARLGRIVEALRCYTDYRARLIDDVGVSPSSPLVELEQRVLEGSLAPPARPEPSMRMGFVDALSPLSPSRKTSPLVQAPSGAAARSTPWNSPIAMRPVFVGREAVLATIRRVLQSKPEALSCCYVSGDGGIGKTRVVIECLAMARRLGRPTRLLQCRPPPAAPFAALEGIDPSDAFAPGAGVRWHEPDARSRVVASYADVLQRAIEPGSLLVVEDLHWADEGTLEALASLVTRLSFDAAACTFLLTSRPMLPGAPPREAVERLLRDMPTTTLLLDGLSEPEVFQLIRGAADVDPQTSLTDTLCQHGHGNPLLALTGLQSLRSSGDLRWDGRALAATTSTFRSVPGDLSGSLDRIMSDLDEPVRRMLEELALAGGPMAFDALPSLDPLGSGEAVGIVAAAEAVGLVETDDRMVRFCHHLYQHVIEEGVAAVDRTERHRDMFARLMPSVDGGGLREAFDMLETEHLTRLAHHASGAGQLLPMATRFAAFEAAAYRSLVDTDWIASARSYRMALALAEEVGVAGNALIALQADAGAALFRAHDSASALALLDHVVEHAEATDDLDLWATSLADRDRARAFLARVVGRPDLSSVERFVRAAADRRPEQCARLLALGAEQLFSAGDIAAARILIDRATDIAPQGAGPLLDAELSFAAGLTRLGELALDEATDLFLRSAHCADVAGSPWVHSWGLGRLGFVKLVQGDLAGAERVLRQARAAQLNAGSWGELSFTTTLEAHLAHVRGDEITTDVLVAQANRLLHRSGYSFTAQFLFPLVLQRAAAGGDPQAAESAEREWALFTGRTPRIHRVLRRVICDDEAGARDELLNYQPLANGPFGPGHLTLIAAQHRVAHLLSDIELAAATQVAVARLAERGVRYLPGVGIDL